MKRISAFAAAAALACALGMSAAQAAPVQPAGAATAISGDGLVTQVHGGHGRACRWGPVWRWNGKRVRHRHIGRQVRVCGKRWRGRGRPHGWQKRGCFKLGPVWYCP